MKKLLLIFILIIFSLSFALAQKQNLKPNRSLETYILKGPAFNLESNYAEFEFKGVNFRNPNDNIYFQVKLLPFDVKWENVYSSKKVYYSLPKGSYKATLMVRAVNYKNQYDPTPAYYTFKVNISKFYKDVSISPSFDGLSLTLINNSNKEIKITNWQIRTSLISFKIPKAVKDFHPDQNLRKEENIVLQPYGRLVISAVYENEKSAPRNLRREELRLSPLGVNFLGNQCFNYINDYNLNYPVSFCDRISFSSEELLNLVFSGKISRRCAIKISSLGCGPLRAYDYRILQDDPQCLGFVEDFYNYKSCYERNKNNKNFFEKEWRVYFDPRSDLDKAERKPLPQIFRTRFEKIRLEDENGLLVNEYKFY
jgi:hypothetical protein